MKSMGCLNSERPSAYFWPGSFSEGGELEKYLTNGVSYGPEILIDCRVLEIGKATKTTRWTRDNNSNVSNADHR